MTARMLEVWQMLTTSGLFSSKRFRTFFLYTKEPLEELMYGSMIRRTWFLALGASPIYLVMMPMFSLLLIGLALVDIYDLVKAKQKNLDLWLNAIIGSICACMATISITLLEISLLTGTTFVIGPWIFLASLVIFSENALFQCGLNLWRASNSTPDTQNRLNHLQSAINWLFIFATTSCVIGSAFFVILFPSLYVPAGTACAVATVALTTTSLLWRMMPRSIKLRLKQKVGLEKIEQFEKETSITTYNKTSLCAKGRYATSQVVNHPEDGLLAWCYSSRLTTPTNSTDPLIKEDKKLRLYK